MGNIYENFKADSAKFRSLQKKKTFSNQLMAYELGYNNGPLSKKIQLYSQLKKEGSYVWIMKDSNNKVKLIVFVNQIRQEEMSNHITILFFDENQNLKFYRNEFNDHMMILKTKNTNAWVSDGDSQSCDYFFIEGNVMVDKPYCDPKEILSEYHGGTIAVNSEFVKPTLPEILKAFGIYKF
jgi:hypothetical protein